MSSGARDGSQKLENDFLFFAKLAITLLNNDLIWPQNLHIFETLSPTIGDKAW